MSDPLAIYIHWPFCKAKCPYCDFNSHVRESIDQARWMGAYRKTLEYYAGLTGGREVTSVFFGGGTPSLMPAQTVEEIIKTIQLLWPVSSNVEITLEANPTSVEAGKFREFRAAGVNRVSLGVQSLIDEDLKTLGREHNVKEALQALDIARENFDRFSFDLIYARPDQKLADWEKELRQAAGLAAGHLSLYQLTIERNTPFYFDYSQKKFSIPDEDLAADFYHLTQDLLEAEGLPAYEVSNHARAGAESRHNLTYWHYGDYIGAGPGAHGRLTLDGRKFATREHAAPEIWLQKVDEQGHAHAPFEDIPPQDRFLEALMMGLRLREGVSIAKLEREGRAKITNFLDAEKLAQLREQKWLEENEDSLILTREGRLRLNAVIPFVLKAEARRQDRG